MAQALWRAGALLVGTARRPPHGMAMSEHGEGGGRGGARAPGAAAMAKASGLALNPLLMSSRPLRDALLHIRWVMLTELLCLLLRPAQHDSSPQPFCVLAIMT